MPSLDRVGGENSTGEPLREVSPRHSVWDRKKSSADDLAALYAVAHDQDMRRHADKIYACSEMVVLQEVVEEAFRASSFKCRERHCPICQAARSMTFQHAFTEALPRITTQVENARFLFLTLTVKNCLITELRETIRHMNSAYTRLMKRQELRLVLGWIRGTEVTRSSNGRAHPHFHIILLVTSSYFQGKNYLSQSDWTQLWRSAAKLDYDPIVHIKAVKDTESAAQEAIKAASYSIKPDELADDPEWLHELHRQVFKLRFLATGGLIKSALAHVDLEIEADDLAETKEDGDGDGNGRRLMFGWRAGERLYRRRF